MLKIDCVFLFSLTLAGLKTQKPIRNMGTLQNCSLKKCISQFSPQKYEHKQEKILVDKYT